MTPPSAIAAVLSMALLVSCGRAQSIAPQLQATLTESPALSALSRLSGEGFTASDVTVHVVECNPFSSGEKYAATFMASGSASGPYPGAFTASGSWSAGDNGLHEPHWGFVEQFQITSGKRSINGVIKGSGAHTFGPVGGPPCNSFGSTTNSGTHLGEATVPPQRRGLRPASSVKACCRQSCTNALR